MSDLTPYDTGARCEPHVWHTCPTAPEHCITCGDARVYEVGGHEPDFDRHPYETKEA